MTTEEHQHDHAHDHEHTTTEDGWSVCEVHPERETALRCNKCGRYMCVECAVQTPVGYRCKECVREQEDKFFTGASTDYFVIFAVTLVLGFLGGILVALIPFILFALILSAPVGGVIGEAALRAIKRRRSRHSARSAAAGAAIGALALLALGGGLTALIYGAIAASAVYGRFQMRI